MKTIILDIDGTITNMQPIEKIVFLHMSNKKITNKKERVAVYNQIFSRLLKNGQMPQPEKYPLVNWLIANKNKYRFLYATGGQKPETLYVLKSFKLTKYFDLANSVDKTRCRFSKKTGIPFKKIKSKFDDCLFITDSQMECRGATKAKVPCVLVKPKQKFSDSCLSRQFLTPAVGHDIFQTRFKSNRALRQE